MHSPLYRRRLKADPENAHYLLAKASRLHHLLATGRDGRSA